MKAVVVGEERPQVTDISEPAIGPHDVLVRVRAAALNRADLAMAAGRPHGRAGGAGATLGLEWAGEVVETGSEVTEVRPGDRVACSGAGGFAEYAVTDRGRILPMGEHTGFEAAATLPVAVQTMHDALVTNGRMQEGDAVLVQGASSGVGLMALQIAKRRGARVVIGTSTNAGRRARLAGFGADLALDSNDGGWVQQVFDATEGKGVDVVIDQVSGALMNDTMRATRILGRIVNVGRLGGMKAEFDFDLHALRRIDYIGVTFRTRSAEEVRDITRLLREDGTWDAALNGELHLPIDSSYALEDAAEALQEMRENRHFGKIVLTVGGEVTHDR